MLIQRALTFSARERFSLCMGLDSVELVIGWEQTFDISISNGEAAAIRTPADAIELLATKVGATSSNSGPCLSMRAFHTLRKTIITTTRTSRNAIRPDTDLREITQETSWADIRSASGISELRKPSWLGPKTMADLARWSVANAAHQLKPIDQPWTIQQVRFAVRAVVTSVTGVTDFADDDDFIRDLGID